MISTVFNTGIRKLNEMCEEEREMNTSAITYQMQGS
jgi:hypothetical protein